MTPEELKNLADLIKSGTLSIDEVRDDFMAIFGKKKSGTKGNAKNGVIGVVIDENGNAINVDEFGKITPNTGLVPVKKTPTFPSPIIGQPVGITPIPTNIPSNPSAANNSGYGGYSSYGGSGGYTPTTVTPMPNRNPTPEGGWPDLPEPRYDTHEIGEAPPEPKPVALSIEKQQAMLDRIAVLQEKLDAMPEWERISAQHTIITLYQNLKRSGYDG